MPQSRNRALTDIVAARDAALRIASIKAGASFFLLLWGEDRLAAKFDAVRLRVGAAWGGALQNAAALQRRSHAKDGEDDLGKISCGVEEGFGQ